MRALDDDHTGHPFAAGRPSATRLSVWGVAMRESGHQVAHIHPAAWLSGVYYPRVPESVRPGDPEQRGWIEFGRPPEDVFTRREPAVHAICPTEGLLVLFPAYLYHRTIPLAGDAHRISIAFDVLPSRA